MVWLLSLSKVHGKKVGSNLIHEPKAEENLIGKKWKWSRSVMSDSVTKWTVAHQAPLSKGFSRQEYRVGCHSLLQGIFPPRDGTWVSRIAGKCFTLWATREAPAGKNWELIGQRSPADYNPWGCKRVRHDLVTKEQQKLEVLPLKNRTSSLSATS